MQVFSSDSKNLATMDQDFAVSLFTIGNEWIIMSLSNIYLFFRSQIIWC